MKNLSLFVSAFALCASTSYAAINCGTLPTCESLGYTDTVSQCPKSVNDEEMVIRCPFDTGKPDKEAKGKCIYEAAIGQIGYFTTTPASSSGWLLCDGKTYSYKTYPQLAKRIGTQFGGTKDNTFTVPDYRGFFLRVYAEGTTEATANSRNNVCTGFSTYSGDVNKSMTVPQKESLPNIRASWRSAYEMDNMTPMLVCSGVSCSQVESSNLKTELPGHGGHGYLQRNFAASLSNPIYGRPINVSTTNPTGTDTVSHVVPGNMAVHAYIYAGKVVK